MTITLKRGTALRQKTPCLVLGVFEGERTVAEELDRDLAGLLARARRSGEFTGKPKELLVLQPLGTLPMERLLLVGLGKSRGFDLERLRRYGAAAGAALRERKLGAATIVLPPLPSRHGGADARYQAAAEGLLLAAYRFERYRSDRGPALSPERLTLLAERGVALAEASAGVARAEQIVRAVCVARDLVNEPGNVKSPAYLAERARALAAEVGLECRVLERSELEREGLGALLGVAQGSVRAPQLIVLEHRGGGRGEPPVALVGKGVVFDAGGISLKPAEKMDEMKMDMAGGAAVIGVLMAAALLRLPLNLVGLVPAVENLPSGSAMRPGDILTSLSGKTIEVLNTDAEGRLILADALTYARRFEPRLVIDLATLTGACVIALGHHASAVLGNHTGLVRELIRAGEQAGERLWQLPLWEEYAAQISSEVADLKNVGGKAAGTITAAAFLGKFADGLHWAHLDIAGTAWEEQGRPGVPKGGTGVGVRLLVQYLRQLAARDSSKAAP